MRGLYNFDRIRIEFYRDRQAGFEAFKKGEMLFREEFTSRIWATGYDFPALHARQGDVKREFPAEKRPTCRPSAVNQRRREISRPARAPGDRLVLRLRMDEARTCSTALYERSQSAFERSAYKAEGLPSPGEIALLEPLRGPSSRQRHSAKR